MQERERDPAGRARNARPRDRHGRPLPRGAVGVERVPDDVVFGPDDGVAEAQRLLDAGLPFPAHDVLESVWKAAPPAEREVWRALAQVAVGLTHAQRGNPAGPSRCSAGPWTGSAAGSARLRRASISTGCGRTPMSSARRIEGSGSAISPRPTCGSGCASDHRGRRSGSRTLTSGRWSIRDRVSRCVECGDVLVGRTGRARLHLLHKDACQARHHRGLIVTAVGTNKGADTLIVADPDEVRRRGEAGEFTRKDTGLGLDYRPLHADGAARTPAKPDPRAARRRPARGPRTGEARPALPRDGPEPAAHRARAGRTHRTSPSPSSWSPDPVRTANDSPVIGQ